MRIDEGLMRDLLVGPMVFDVHEPSCLDPNLSNKYLPKCSSFCLNWFHSFVMCFLKRKRVKM